MTAVRIAEPGDAAGIAAELKTQTPVADVERQIATAPSRGAVQFVAIDEGKVVGMAALLPSRFLPSDHRGELADFIVTPSHRGSTTSRLILEAVIEEARRRGFTQLDAATRDTGPVAAFLRLGFREWGRMPKGMRQRDGSYHALVMFALDLD